MGGVKVALGGGVPPPQGEGYSLRLPVCAEGGGPPSPPWGDGWRAGVMVNASRKVTNSKM
jgi:hypothetical protein